MASRRGFHGDTPSVSETKTQIRASLEQQTQRRVLSGVRGSLRGGSDLRAHDGARRRVQLAARAHAAPVGRVEQVTQSRDVALRRELHDALAAPGSSRAVERASRGRRPATGAPASRGRESQTRRSRGGRRAHRVRGVECASATDERACPSVSEDTTPAWKTARFQKKSRNMRHQLGEECRETTPRDQLENARCWNSTTRGTLSTSHTISAISTTLPRLGLSPPPARLMICSCAVSSLCSLARRSASAAMRISSSAIPRGSRARGLRARLPASGGRAGSSGAAAAPRGRPPRSRGSGRGESRPRYRSWAICNGKDASSRNLPRGPARARARRRLLPVRLLRRGHAIAAASSPSGITARTIASLSRPPAPRIHATFRSRSCVSRRDASSASSISDSRSASAFSRALCFARRAPGTSRRRRAPPQRKAKPDDAPPRAQRVALLRAPSGARTRRPQGKGWRRGRRDAASAKRIFLVITRPLAGRVMRKRWLELVTYSGRVGRGEFRGKQKNAVLVESDAPVLGRPGRPGKGTNPCCYSTR